MLSEKVVIGQERFFVKSSSFTTCFDYIAYIIDNRIDIYQGKPRVLQYAGFDPVKEFLLLLPAISGTHRDSI